MAPGAPRWSPGSSRSPGKLRSDDLILTVLRSAPELAMIYIAGRLGTSQQILIDAVAEELRSAQADGSVRAGDARELAAMVLLITQSTIQSGQIVEPILDADSLSAELTRALNGYLADARPDRPQRRPPRPPTWPPLPAADSSTCSSSAAGSPARASRWTPPAAG